MPRRSANTVWNVAISLNGSMMESFRTLIAKPGFVAVLGLMLCRSLLAQELERNSKADHSEPRLRIVTPSLTELETKLKWLIELSPDPQLRKQWKKLKQDLIEAYTDGVDQERPIVADVVFSPTGLSYDLRIPILDLTDERTGFLAGLRGRDYAVRRLSKNTYEILGEDQQPAHMLFEQDYAWIATGSRRVPTPPSSLAIELAPILKLKKDVVVELKNQPDDMKLRRAEFQAFREHVEGSGRKRRKENQNAFELRKALSKHFLAAAEQFIVEAASIQLTWNIDAAAAGGTGRGEVSLMALPGTALANLIDEAGTKPGYFDNAARHENVVASAVLSVVVDSLRSQQLKELGKSLRPIIENMIDARTPTIEREAWARVVNRFFKMTDKLADLGTIDGFVELFEPIPGQHVLICGIRAADGKDADEIVTLVPGFRTDWEVKLKAHEHGGVCIHEIRIGKQDLATLQSAFPNEQLVYVGTSQGAVWIAAGMGALGHLKRCIDRVNDPVEKINPVLFRYQVHVARLASLIASFHRRDSLRKVSLTQDDRQFQKDIEKYTNLIHDVTAQCDSSFGGELRRSGDRIEGFTELNACVLRCVGSILASMLKDLE